jgi:hypothetical protein
MIGAMPSIRNGRADPMSLRTGVSDFASRQWQAVSYSLPVMLGEEVSLVNRSGTCALTILEVLAEAKNGYTLSELGRRLGLPKSSLHTMLRPLEDRGYVSRNPATHRFRLGLRVFTLAKLALRELGLVE